MAPENLHWHIKCSAQNFTKKDYIMVPITKRSDINCIAFPFKYDHLSSICSCFTSDLKKFYQSL